MMTFRYFKPACATFLLFVFACLLPFAASSTTDQEILDKRIKVADEDDRA